MKWDLVEKTSEGLGVYFEECCDGYNCGPHPIIPYEWEDGERRYIVGVPSYVGPSYRNSFEVSWAEKSWWRTSYKRCLETFKDQVTAEAFVMILRMRKLNGIDITSIGLSERQVLTFERVANIR